MSFRSQKIKQHKSVGVLIVCHFLSSLSWREKLSVSWFNNFIGRLSLATKPRPQKLANLIDRLIPALVSVATLVTDTHLAAGSITGIEHVHVTIAQFIGTLAGLILDPTEFQNFRQMPDRICYAPDEKKSSDVFFYQSLIFYYYMLW